MKFSDGQDLDLSGPLRIVCLSDGYYAGLREIWDWKDTYKHAGSSEAEREIADHTGAMTTAHRGTSSVSPETPEP